MSRITTTPQVKASGVHTYPVSSYPEAVVDTFRSMVEAVLQHSANHSHQNTQADLNVLLANQSVSRGIVIGGKDGQMSLTS